MNKKEYKIFIDLVEKEDKDSALLFILGLLDKGESITDIYENLLIPALSDYECLMVEQEICIWKEHTRTSIIRTILEASYTYVIKEKQKRIGKKVIVLCPQEEYHEIGAIIATHYFSIAGLDASYIGANTPSEDIISAIKVLHPDFIALSVTNYYNLVITKRLTERIRKEYPDIKIILGGQAFTHGDALKQVTYDYNINTYQEILNFSKEVAK